MIFFINYLSLTLSKMNYSTVNNILASCTKGTPLEIIYDSGSWPGVPRNVEFVSFYYLSNSQSSMYLDVYEKGQYKTFCVESISSVKKLSPLHPLAPVKDPEVWNSGNKIHFIYNKDSGPTEREVTFVKYLNPRTKTTVQCIENGQTKNFKINKIQNPTHISNNIKSSTSTENEILKTQLSIAHSKIQELEEQLSQLSIKNSGNNWEYVSYPPAAY